MFAGGKQFKSNLQEWIFQQGAFFIWEQSDLLASKKEGKNPFLTSKDLIQLHKGVWL